MVHRYWNTGIRARAQRERGFLYLIRATWAEP